MAGCIQANLEADEPRDDDVAAAVERSETRAPRPAAAARPVSAFALMWHLVVLRFRRLFGPRSA
jgi:hypothetical protein